MENRKNFIEGSEMTLKNKLYPPSLRKLERNTKHGVVIEHTSKVIEIWENVVL